METTAPPLDQKEELLACCECAAYFTDNYCYIFDPIDVKDWLPFKLWDDQFTVIDTIHEHDKIVILKARQLGLSWLVLCYALWLMLFRPSAVIMLFSKRDDEAIELLDFRLKGIYDRLPPWMKCAWASGSAHSWELSNGSRAKAFPTTGGRSYTASMVIVDEADYVVDIIGLMTAVKPTVDAGGKLVVLSTANKATPISVFKNIYRGAKSKATNWKDLFLPWQSRPERDAAWYEEQKRDIFAATGSLDLLSQEYPATDTEALAPNSQDKRIPAAWLEQCYMEQAPLSYEEMVHHVTRDLDKSHHPAAIAALPNIPGLDIYAMPDPGQVYVGGCDPAEGNPTSDDSATVFLNVDTGEEVASLVGKFDPSVMADYANRVAVFFNHAAMMVERNNHGHAVILWFTNFGQVQVLTGHDTKTGKMGWLSSGRGKALLYDNCADEFRNGQTILHSFQTFVQLASIEGNTLLAPDNMKDDRADGYALALQGRKKAGVFEVGTGTGDSMVGRAPQDIGYRRDREDQSLAQAIEGMDRGRQRSGYDPPDED